jgi:hypothetical protein
METFTRKIVVMMKEHELFSWQGGPIILAQVRSTPPGGSGLCCTHSSTNTDFVNSIQ